MPQLHYKFDSDLNAQEQARIKEFIENAFRTGDIIA